MVSLISINKSSSLLSKRRIGTDLNVYKLYYYYEFLLYLDFLLEVVVVNKLDLQAVDIKASFYNF